MKNMDYKLSPIKESIFIIDWLSTYLNDTVQISNREELHKKDNYVIRELFRLSFIRTCIILQEWKNLESLSKENKKLRNTLRITSPFIRELKNWTGLHKYRSTVLAHFGRDKEGEFIPYWRALKGLKYPTTTWDFNFINSLITTSTEALIKRHHADLKQPKKILNKDKERFEEALYTHILSIKSDEEYELRKKIIWDDFVKITLEVIDEEKENFISK